MAELPALFVGYCKVTSNKLNTTMRTALHRSYEQALDTAVLLAKTTITRNDLEKEDFSVTITIERA